MSKGALCVIPVLLPQFTVKQSKTDFHAGCLRMYFRAKNNLSKAEMGEKKLHFFSCFLMHIMSWATWKLQPKQDVGGIFILTA